MQAAHFHFYRRDAPLGMLKIKFPFGGASSMARSSAPIPVMVARWMTFGAVNAPRKSTDGSRSAKPVPADRPIKLIAAQPPRSLVSPARLNFAKNRKQLWRGDFGYGALPLAG
jgi:hypothetical protein